MEAFSEEINFKEADQEDIPIIHDLAVKIWRKYYPSIISNEQIEYMLNKMYSPESLSQQMKEGNIFWIVYDILTPIGYLSYSNKGNGNYFLHKLYVDVDSHGKGIGHRLFNHVFSKIHNLKSIRLTVNRKNMKAINYYFRNDFIIEEVKDFDIGDGFFMKDFVMVKKGK